ncbi:MAG: ATP-binding cassette domain-containing protein [Patescibacteria group bacterium]|jgi:ABC-2 type transport system ATP-binding protein
MNIISAKGITKNFSKSKFDWRHLKINKEDHIAVSGLDLEIEEGEFVGFLGPNGAGKTTFLKILSGIVHPTKGEAKVLGFVPWARDYKYLRQIAIVMGQKNQLWWDIPAIDSYQMLQAVYDIPNDIYKKNLDEMVTALDMKELLTKRLREMSLGERMKCELVACFLHNPKVIFLDEPTIGLDVVSSQTIRAFLKKINREKKCTLILTSHYMGDIEELCERVVIINKGQKVYDGNLNKLKEQYAPEKIIEIYLETIEEKKKFAHLDTAKKKLDGHKGIIRVKKTELGQIVKEVYSTFDAENISISDPDMEEIVRKIFKQ